MNKLVIGGVLAALALGGGFYWMRLRPDAVAQAAAAPEPPPKLAYVDAKELTMRLSDPSVEHYIKLAPVLAVRAKAADDVTDRLAEARDCIIGVVTARSSNELLTPQGEAALKRDVAAALKKDFHDEIVEVYFSEYLVE